jgi:hypothetical protein
VDASQGDGTDTLAQPITLSAYTPAAVTDLMRQLSPLPRELHATRYFSSWYYTIHTIL